MAYEDLTIEALKERRAGLVRKIDQLRDDLGTAEAILEEIEEAIDQREKA
jgi:hypothetical protein